MQRITVGIAIVVAAVLCATLLGGCVGSRKGTARVTRTNPAWRPESSDSGSGR
jgi:hypothetical protein